MSVTMPQVPSTGTGTAAANTSAPSAKAAAQAAVLDAAAGSVAPQPQPAPSREQVQQAVENLKQIVQPVAQNLQFSIDEDSGRTIIRVIDSQSDEVIRQIPSEEVLEIAKALDRLSGLLLRQQA